MGRIYTPVLGYPKRWRGPILGTSGGGGSMVYTWYPNPIGGGGSYSWHRTPSTYLGTKYGTPSMILATEYSAPPWFWYLPNVPLHAFRDTS